MGLLSALPGAVAQGIIWGIMAIGVFVTFKILDIADLTVDGSICTGAVVFTVLMLKGVNAYIALAGAAVAGILAGIVTGLFHTLLGIPAILSGILTQLILWSANLKILGKANQSIPSRQFDVMLSQNDITIALIVLAIVAAILIAVLYWLFGTEFGSGLRATGCNLNMSRAQGINTGFYKIVGLALSNGIVALSGALLCQYQGFADINMGRGAIVIGLAAVIIGEALFSKLARNFALRLISVIIGGIIYYIVYQAVISTGFDSDLLKMFSALIVAIFLGTPYIKKTYFSSKRAKKGASGNA